jgi:hypothetical protein
MPKKRNSQPIVNQDVDVAPITVDTVPVPVPVAAPPPGVAPVQNPRLMDIDKMALDLAKEQRKTALAEAKTALANNEKADLAFRYVVLQLYMKYGLTDADAISEQGEIVRGGAVRQPPQGR